MTKELCFVIDQISREKGISRESLVEVLEAALLSAARKKFSSKSNIGLRIDPKTCEISVFETMTVVDELTDPETEMRSAEAAAAYPGKVAGDTIEIPIPMPDFGRIAAQTAKQVIFQKVRDAEREIIFDEYKDKIGQVVSGTVLRRERGCYFLSVGKAEAVMPIKEAMPNENLKRGDIVKALLADVRHTIKGPAIMLSRTDPNFIVGLFKMEVPEINDGVVIIKGIAREAGERTKIAVTSKDQSIDAVGACVGMKGTRVQSIVRELRGERIDIIQWSEDPRLFIARSLTPANVDRVGINEEAERTAMVIADDQQLSLAIGKRGQNIKLATKLTGWEIEVISESEYSKMKIEQTDRSLDEALKIETKKNKSNEA
ncbi:MAG: transcription termination/antitermination protein NusA [Nitrospirae bacterium]|nr:transcription termination/antitermination protein NusA [Nitrospirota bacterium]